MIDFLILYEYKARELDNDCLIKAELEKRGYKVDLFNIYEYKHIRHLTYDKPKVIMTPYLYRNQEFYDIVYPRVGKIRKIVNLQWEQILSKKWVDIGFHLPKEDAVYIPHICWGKGSSDRLKQAGVNHAMITGPIQMDFLRDYLRRYYKTRDQITRKYKLDNSKKIVLYISSFTYSNMTGKDIKALEDRVSGNIDDIKEIMAVSKLETVKWIDRLLTDRKDITFIYRPHPSEKDNISLVSLQMNHENFKVIGDDSVKQWILIADRIFTWISTSIAEVYFSNKSCSILRPVKMPENLDAEININAKVTDSYEKMVGYIDSDASEFPVSEDVIKKYYSFHDVPSYIRICNLLEKVLKTDQYDLTECSAKINNFRIFWNSILDETIMKLHLYNKPDEIRNAKLAANVKGIQDNYKLYSREMVPQREIHKLVHKIRRMIG